MPCFINERERENVMITRRLEGKGGILVLENIGDYPDTLEHMTLMYREMFAYYSTSMMHSSLVAVKLGADEYYILKDRINGLVFKTTLESFENIRAQHLIRSNFLI